MFRKRGFFHPAESMDRRSFIKLSGLLGIGFTTMCAVPAAAESVRFDRKMYKVSRTRLALGTIVSITAIHPSQAQAEEAMGFAFEEIERLAGLMNRFESATAISCLNKEGRLKDTPPELGLVVDRALHYCRLTGGAFDVTVKPIVDLFQEKYEKGKPLTASEAEVKELLRLVDARNVQVTGRSVSFKTPGIGITLDGIAKGYIVDKASEILSGRKIMNHLINAGGDIRTVGSAAEGKPWTIAIQDPFQKREYPDKIRMMEGAIATSGNYEVYYDKEKMFHHIVNPKTGFSPAPTASVSVVAKTTMEADALSTSVFVMDPGPGTRFIDSLPDCQSLVIDRKGVLHKSKGWKSAQA